MKATGKSEVLGVVPLWCALLLVSSSFGQVAQGNNENLARAIDEYNHGNLQTAEDTLRNVLAQGGLDNAHSAQAHAVLGLIEARQGKSSEAEAELHRALALAPGNPDYTYNLAALLVAEHRPRGAIPLLQQLRRDRPDSPDVLINLARAEAEAGDSQQLAVLVRTLPAARLNDTAFLRELTNVLVAGRHPTAAISLWREVIARDPANELAYATASTLLVDSRKANEAKGLLASAPASVQTSPLYRYALANAQLASRDFSAAQASFAALVEQMPSNRGAWIGLIRAQLAAGKASSAVKSSEAAQKQFPADATFAYDEAVADYMLSRDAPAIEALNTALSISHDYEAAVLLMAVLQSRQGNYDRATEYFERALRSNETCNPLARYFFGTMLIRKRDLAGAEQQLREALRCRPRFALAEARLAQALDETNRSSEARAMAKRAISDGPDLAEGFYIYAQIERRLGNTAEAQRAMNHFNVLRQQSEGEQSLIAPAIQ